ncbi:hypothetical protein KFL_005780040 [Klebsormidium nitens]|uniref:Vacuolar fusion protein MON1 homolog n=1 Tax=Klebsormidium nitens TaxID=105231 RepID=A0A1Y1IMA5_KLENI|nr:hypothetical protein KFL_005780040 [Klebsormidium nitens]|eukprot:GAQ89926.1 hypothetical protein KFL_005780040 [Klebsormidium nitens]
MAPPPLPNESKRENGGSSGPNTVHPTAAAAQAAAGAASSAAMAGVMLALKALKTTAESNGGVEQRPRRRQGELQNRGKNAVGEPEGGPAAGVKRHRKKRNGAGQGVRLDVPMGGLEGPMVSLQGGPPGRFQSSSKALAGLPKGGSLEKPKRGGGAQGSDSGASRREGLGLGSIDRGEGGAQRFDTQRPERTDEESGQAGSPAERAAAPSSAILQAPPVAAKASSPEIHKELGDANVQSQRGGQDADGVQIEDPPGVGEGYLGSSGSAVEGLSERSTSDSSLAEARGGCWTPGKKHTDEDDSSESWRKRKRHFFILSNAGKPIYSRYGDEHKLAGFSATLQAIMSYVENSKDTIHSIRAGAHKIVFMARGPIYLVAISATGEPESSLLRKLDLLYGQLISILTDSIERTFRRNQKFDVHSLLGGTEPVFASLMHVFSWDYAVLLRAFTCLPLPYAARQAAGVALQEIASPGLVFGLLLAPAGKIISLVAPRRTPPHPDDVLLLCNFVGASESFRTSESFVPLCLYRYNPSAFLYAYVGYLEPEVCLVLLTSQQDGFFHLKECRAHIEQSLRITGVFREVAAAVTRGGLRVEEVPSASAAAQRRLAAGTETGEGIGSLPSSRSSITASNHTLRQKQTASGDASTSGRWGPGRSRDEGLSAGLGGPAGIWHFLYRHTAVDQYLASEYSPPLETRAAQKRVFQTYQRLLASMQGDGAKSGPHRMQYRRDSEFVMLAWSTSDFDFYAVFDPLADKDAAIAVCNRVCTSIRQIEGDLFQTGPVPLAW